MNRAWGILACVFLAAPLGVQAAADKMGKPAAATAAEKPAKSESWGERLPQTLKISLWSDKDGEAKAGSISTSRENFEVFFEMGKSRKTGLRIALRGRVLPVGNGSYEVMLNGRLEGGDESKGGLGLKIRCSTIVKKGEAAVLAGSKDGKMMLRVD